MIVREVLKTGGYERPLMGFEVVPGERWLDVGAHIGCFTALALAAGTFSTSTQTSVYGLRKDYGGLSSPSLTSVSVF